MPARFQGNTAHDTERTELLVNSGIYWGIFGNMGKSRLEIDGRWSIFRGIGFEKKGKTWGRLDFGDSSGINKDPMSMIPLLILKYAIF